MDQWLEEIRAALPELVVYQQEPMKKHTTFRVEYACTMGNHQQSGSV